jgi:GxxExxY protein
MQSINEITEKIIGCAMKVHSKLGPGLLESTYQECLYYELIQLNFSVEKQKALPLIYNDVKLECGYRIDLLVEGCVVVEIKSVEELAPIHLSQTLTYLKLSNNKVGLLINFNVVKLKDGKKELSMVIEFLFYQEDGFSVCIPLRASVPSVVNCIIL